MSPLEMRNGIDHVHDLTQGFCQGDIIQVGGWVGVKARPKRSGPVRAGRRTWSSGEDG